MSKKFLYALVSLAAGGLYVLAFAPIGWYVFAFIAPTILLGCWKAVTPKQAFFYGLCFGLGEFGLGTSWIYVSIHNFGNANALLAGLITFLFTLILMIFPATHGYFFRTIFRNCSAGLQYLLGFPLSWISFEALRGWLFTGFPWLMVGYSQTTSVLRGYAPLVGVYGVGCIVMFICGALTLTVTRRKIAPVITIMSIGLIGLPLSHHLWTHPIGSPQSVALVQGNIPQRMKWDPRYIQKTIHRYVDTTPQCLHYDIIVWPEAAIPVLAENMTALINDLDQQARRHHSTLIFGIPHSNRDKTKYYNSMIAVGAPKQERYDKRHLVPFGEYIPLPRVFGRVMHYFSIPMSDTAAGAAHQRHLRAGPITIAPFICYEMTYPITALRWSESTQLLIVINDDSWFGNSLAAAQQVQMAAFRALETGRYLLYVSNTGITTIIAPNGRFISTAPKNVFYVLTGRIQGMDGRTPLMWAFNWLTKLWRCAVRLV